MSFRDQTCTLRTYKRLLSSFLFGGGGDFRIVNVMCVISPAISSDYDLVDFMHVRFEFCTIH